MYELTDKPINGSGLLAIFCNLNEEDQKEFHPWLLNEMFPARLKIGFNSCASFEKVNGDGQKFLTLYEVDNIVYLYDEPYQKLRENRSPLDARFHKNFLNLSRYTLQLIPPSIEKNQNGFLNYIKILRQNINSVDMQKYHSNFISNIRYYNKLPLRRYANVEGEHNNFTIIESDDMDKLKEHQIDNYPLSYDNKIDALYECKIQLI
jgi:hypothetical protein